MVHKWVYSDGTVVRWTSKGSVLISGDTYLAKNLRWLFTKNPQYGVEILPSPSGDVPLDTASVWMVNRWLDDIVRYAWAWGPRPFDYVDRQGSLVSSTYKPKDEDIPPRIAEMIRLYTEHAASEPDTDEHGNHIIY